MKKIVGILLMAALCLTVFGFAACGTVEEKSPGPQTGSADGAAQAAPVADADTPAEAGKTDAVEREAEQDAGRNPDGDTPPANANEGRQGNQYYSVTAPISIDGADSFDLVLTANEGWEWNIPENTDVTSWLVKADLSPAFAETVGVAFGHIAAGTREDVEGEIALTLTVEIDASKITAFRENGSYELYVAPPAGSTLWVVGDNRGQYSGAAEPAGTVDIPEISVDGIFTGSANGGITLDQETVQIVLSMEGLDDSRIDASEAEITLLPGDGYHEEDVSYTPGELGEVWTDGRADYSFGELSAVFSPLGGDGNGHHCFRIGLGGLRYNGLPLDTAVIWTDLYSFGRTFSITNGSLIWDTEPLWSAEAEIPVLCDPYPDTFTAVWPIGMDASGVAAEDVAVVLRSEYGQSYTLSPEEYTVETAANQTVVTTNYIHWGYAPVYTTLEVAVSAAHLERDGQMYAPKEAYQGNFPIASVYAYDVMSGGPSGTQAWTFYGLANLADFHQVYRDATYILVYTDDDGGTSYYAEDAKGKGYLTDAADEALSVNCNEECDVKLVGNTVYYDRVSGSEEKTVDGETILFQKSYVNCETLVKTTEELGDDVQLAPGYALGAGWGDSLRWSWQTFIGTGYQGGTK